MTIGHRPLVDTLVLVTGQDFVHEILAPVGEVIASETAVDLVIYGPDNSVIATWDAEVSSASVIWEIASEVADTIQIPATFRIYVHYSDGADFCWYRGQVAREE